MLVPARGEVVAPRLLLAGARSLYVLDAGADGASPLHCET